MKALRELAKSIADRNGVPFYPVYIDTPLEECIHRDVKGHYNSAQRGTMVQFTGISSPFEEPEPEEMRISTFKVTPEECARIILLAE
jgi:bifunctional enzyme CysN/CysC